jgi:hypothetical protein
MLQKILKALERRKLRAELEVIERNGLGDVAPARVVAIIARLRELDGLPNFVFVPGGHADAIPADMGDRRFLVAHDYMYSTDGSLRKLPSDVGNRWFHVVTAGGGRKRAALAAALEQLPADMHAQVVGWIEPSPEVAEFVCKHGGSDIEISHVTPGCIFGTALFDGRRQAFRIAPGGAQ